MDDSLPASDPASHGFAGEGTGGPDGTRSQVVHRQPVQDVDPGAPVPRPLPPDVGR
jgi:hypothetical protein